MIPSGLTSSVISRASLGDGYVRVRDSGLVTAVAQFLYDEAALLDEWRLDEWLALFHPEAAWVVVLTDIEFTDGVVEFDALGQSGPPQSNFLGVAFRVVDEKTHDAVSFRPFNFRADDAERKAHAVQYISHPKYQWFVLRKDKPGRYEKPIVPAPDGDAWFHARLVIERPKVSVYVNNAKEPSLVVEELSDRKGGGIGLWVGPRQGGHFANLKITPAKSNRSGLTSLAADGTAFRSVRSPQSATLLLNSSVRCLTAERGGALSDERSLVRETGARP